jgi:uncharacterized protein (DUF2461 family)
MAVRPPFSFSPEAIQFLADLAANNDRAWFQPRKADYERLLKEPLEALVAALAERFAARGIPLQADPKRSIFRIYRDTRFSKDKSPYVQSSQLPLAGRRASRFPSVANIFFRAACGIRSRPGSGRSVVSSTTTRTGSMLSSTIPATRGRSDR